MLRLKERIANTGVGNLVDTVGSIRRALDKLQPKLARRAIARGVPLSALPSSGRRVLQRLIGDAEVFKCNDEGRRGHRGEVLRYTTAPGDG
jgi:hypothetical protein